MDASPPEDPNLDLLPIERYVAGKCAPAECALIEQAMAERPDVRAAVESMRAVWASIETPAAAYDSRDAWSKVAVSLRGLEEAEAISVRRGRRLLRPLRGLAMTKRLRGLAVTVGVAASVAVVSLLILRPTFTGRSYATMAGQREGITLPDGTRFTLAPASRLRLASDYGRSSRDVYLDGEAYFAVVHDATHPFTVRAAGAVITDVGTQFDVRAYGGDREVRVAVGEGRVDVTAGLGTSATSLRHAPSALRLHGNDTTASTREMGEGDVALVSDTVLTIAHGADVAEVTGWMNGSLTFNATPLREVALELGRWYDVRIVAPTGVLAERPFTATLANEPAESALRIVAAAVGAQLERSGETYRFGLPRE